ncbi:hypothetical protein Ahy_B05g075295 [Arachis hypogaea]|uniref:PB1-like domain-containing protein n=1 Tax=Arachis hypogaea TaxID=3818 RepID=A0A444Z0W8_ARAHY|nr:hypothetical protein Ahy_B05g075295 [Arachis hypogaea]
MTNNKPKHLGYPRYNKIYWLEPDLDLAKGMRVFRTNVEVMRMCKSAIKKDNTVYLCFDLLIDANPDIIEDDVVSNNSSESVYEINPPADNVHEYKVINKEVGDTNEKENEDVEVNKGNEVVNEPTVIVNEPTIIVNERNIEVNELNEGTNSAMNEAVNEVNGNNEIGVASTPEKGLKKIRKRHPRPPSNGLSQQKRNRESRQAKIVDKATYENDANDADNEGANEDHNQNASYNANKSANINQPTLDKIMIEEVITENTTCKLFYYVYLDNFFEKCCITVVKHVLSLHKLDKEAPRIEVPNLNREAGDNGSDMYEYESKELCSPSGSDDEAEAVFPQHNSYTLYEKITLELNMEFETMDHFKPAVQKHNIQIGRYVFYLRNEKKRCRVICYNPNRPWLYYCAMTNYPPLFQTRMRPAQCMDGSCEGILFLLVTNV